jgi:hypothetical protein
MFRFALAAAVLTLVLVVGTAGARTEANVYSVQNLVSDTATTAPTTDPSLVNGWGLSAGPTTPWWTSNNGTNTTTLYSGAGTKVALTVAVPGGPTGTVYNGTASDFVVSQNGKSGSARFLFATEGGMILGWSPTVNAATAVPGVDHSTQGAVYKGLTTMSDRLYATDFHNNRVDVFDASFQPVPLAGAFQDKKLPKGFAPFGIQALAGNIFVTFAKQDSAKHDDVAGPGLGYVDEAGARTRPRTRRGGSRSLRRASACSPATCSSATSATAASARTSSAAARGCTRASCASATGRCCRSKASGGSRSATAQPRVPRARSTTPPARAASSTGCSARSPRPASRSETGLVPGTGDAFGARYRARAQRDSGTQSRVRYSQKARPAHSR